ncbi:hypothetical protein ACWC2K_07415 [Streptomyces chattanoogensis]
MARIAVITAPNTGYRNTGMVTVDLALESLRQRAAAASGEDIDATWYTLHPPESAPLRDDIRGAGFPLRFRSLDEHRDELRDHDAVVFWGDFLHARHYLVQDATNRLMDHGMAADRAAARELLHRNLLLADEPDDVLARTLVYGGTILHNTQSDYDDKEYGSAFARLMKRSHRVWMRDPLSAVKVAQLRGDRTAESFGSDAALLSRPVELGLLPVTPWSQGLPEGEAIGVFLGSRTEIPEWLPGFCHEVADRFGARLEWLPWFGRRIPAPVEHLTVRPGERTLGDLVGVLPRYRLVITDTYHLAVNSWGAGTPVMCVGAPQPTVPGDDDYLSLSDLKKHVFHLAYDAADFYLTTAPHTPGRLTRRIDRLVRLVEGGGAAAVAGRIHEHAERSAADVVGALASVVSGPSA